MQNIGNYHAHKPSDNREVRELNDMHFAVWTAD